MLKILLLLVCKVFFFFFSFISEENFAGQSNIDCRFFTFITLIKSSHYLLVWRVSVESSAVIFMGIPLCVIHCFFPATFNSCFLCLIFLSLTNMCLGVFCLQFSSVAQSCPTLYDPMNCSKPGLPVHHKLPEFTQTHVHRVSDAIQPSYPLSSPSPPALNPSQHQSLFQWVNSSREVARVLEFQLQHQCF